MNRRRFLLVGLAFGVSLGLSEAIARSHRFVLYGDGYHDDTEGLQAFFDGREVFWPDGSPVGAALNGHAFYITETIVLRRTGGRPARFMNNCGLAFTRRFGAGAAFDTRQRAGLSIS